MQLGTKVTNNQGWHGVIVERPKDWKAIKPLLFNGNLDPIVYVNWEERERMQGGRILSAKPEQLILIQE